MNDPDTLTYEQTRTLLRLVRARAPHQEITPETIDAWFEDLNGHLTYAEARTALKHYTDGPRFASFRFIAPGDVLDADRALRRTANRTLLVPPPPNPDDVQESINYVRAIRRAYARGQDLNTPPPVMQALQQRRRALSEGAAYVEGTNPEGLRARTSPQVLQVLDQFRPAVSDPVPVRSPGGVRTDPQAADPVAACGDRRCVPDERSPRYGHLIVWDDDTDDFRAQPCPVCLSGEDGQEPVSG